MINSVLTSHSLNPQWINSLDVVIPSFTISAYNKNLFVDSPLTIAHGRHYGLVGPNGKGKSTLLKMIANTSLKIPPRVDALYVEQEVQADETPAFEAVLKADKERWALVEEERQLLRDLSRQPDERKDVRLGQVYEQVCRRALLESFVGVSSLARNWTGWSGQISFLCSWQLWAQMLRNRRHVGSFSDSDLTVKCTFGCQIPACRG